MTDQRRSTDSSKWWKLNEVFSKYKSILWAIVFILLAAGFDFKTPKQAFKELERKDETLFANDTSLLNAIKADRETIKDLSAVVKTLVKLRCNEMTKKDKNLTDICDDLK